MGIKNNEQEILIPSSHHSVDIQYDSFSNVKDGTIETPSITYTEQPERLSFCEVEEPVCLSWKNITVNSLLNKQCCKGCMDEPQQGQYKTIISNVSGHVQSGTLLAIMGASGAGKSTLLNVLTQRNIDDLEIKGEVLVNGHEIGKNMAEISAYVQQDDMFVGSLTVAEQLWFQSILKMDKNMSEKWRTQRINDVMKEMGLGKCRDVVIGTPGKKKGISGGERKRLAVACQIITNPPLLFCDEPTSGLDSFMAQNVVSVLKDMAHKGRTIVCTIHQPSSEVFLMFDRLLLMVEGSVAFLGSRNSALSFFQDCGYPCPSHYNPADHYIQSLAVIPRKQEESELRIKTICDAYKKSVFFDEIQYYQKTIGVHDKSQGKKYEDLEQKNKNYKADWLNQYYAVLWRSWTTGVREPAVLRGRLLQSICLSLMNGLLFFQQKNNQSSITNINGSMYALILQVTYGFTFSVVKTFPAEFPIFLKEHHDGMYRVDVYFISKILAELPQFIIIPCMSCTIVYWMTGLQPALWNFMIALVVVCLVCNVAVSYGYLISSTTSNLSTILAITPILLVPCQLVGGIFVDSRSIPPYLLWLRYISWFTYSNQIMVVTQWENVKNISCTVGLSSRLRMVDENRCIENGLEVIESLGYTTAKEDLVFNFVSLVLMFLVVTLLAFVMLYIRSQKKHQLKKLIKK